MEVGNNKIYDGQFRGNMLVVGKTGCGKTHFLQKLAVNKFFGKLIKTECVGGIDIDKRREAEPDELADLIEKFKLRTRSLIDNRNDSVFGEKASMGRLIVMDDVSGVADNCRKFADFLTVSRKYKYHCIYVFHVIAPETQIWKKIFISNKHF